MERKTLQQLIKWKNKSNRKPLLMTGVRQCGKTLVIFDEIQDCPRAIQSLKYFCENKPELHIIAADNTKAKSLHMFCHRYQPKMAIKTSLKNVGDNMDGNTHVWSLPLYAIFRLKDYVAHEMGW